MSEKQETVFQAIGMTTCVIVFAFVAAFITGFIIQTYKYLRNHNDNTEKIEQLRQEVNELNDSIAVYKEWFNQSVD